MYHYKKFNLQEIVKKSQQCNELVFADRFRGNKPVSSEQNNVRPYSNLFYWNHGFAIESIEFPLHPHQGFEIMTFVLRGSQQHYDTETNRWVSLNEGDFQIIKSNCGIYHAEKLNKGTSSFQIWFDPNFKESLKQKPSYNDFKAADFEPQIKDGFKAITYVGEDSAADVLTPGIVIKKLMFEAKTTTELSLDDNKSYTFYLIKGNGRVDDKDVEEDDAVRLSGEKELKIEVKGDLFMIETPTQIGYELAWE